MKVSFERVAVDVKGNIFLWVSGRSAPILLLQNEGPREFPGSSIYQVPLRPNVLEDNGYIDLTE